jgi:hypothetical protein
VRTSRHRYTEWGPGGAAGIELYDHEHDGGEYRNLAAMPEHAPIRDRLAKLLEEGFAER